MTGIDVNAVTNNGASSFLCCVWSNKVEHIKYLMDKENQEKYGWKLNDIGGDCNDTGENAIHVAARQSNYEVLKYLLTQTNAFQNSNNLNKKADKLEETPLLKCIDTTAKYDAKDELNCDDFKCFQLLLSMTGIDINAVNTYGFSPFLYCIRYDKVEYVKYIMNKENQEKYGWRWQCIEREKSKCDKDVLMVAARFSAPKCLQYIVENSSYLFDNKDWSKALNNVCSTKTGYDAKNELGCRNFHHYVLLYYPKSIRGISVKLTENIPFLHYISIGASAAVVLSRVARIMRSLVIDVLSRLVQAHNSRKNQNGVVQRAANLRNANSNS